MKRKPGERSKDANLYVEIEALRREVAELRAHRSVEAVSQNTPAGLELQDVDKRSSTDEGKAVVDELRTVIEELAESIETGISKRPVAYVLGALLVGILMGRILSR